MLMNESDFVGNIDHHVSPYYPYVTQQRCYHPFVARCLNAAFWNDYLLQPIECTQTDTMIRLLSSRPHRFPPQLSFLLQILQPTPQQELLLPTLSPSPPSQGNIFPENSPPRDFCVRLSKISIYFTAFYLPPLSPKRSTLHNN